MYPSQPPYQGAGPAAVQAPWPSAPAPAPARLPSRAATIVVTALFGVFGAIPAAVHGARAERLGGSARRYWRAFWVTLVVAVAVWAAAVVAVVLVVRGAVSDDDGAGAAPDLPESVVEEAVVSQVLQQAGVSASMFACGDLDFGDGSGYCDFNDRINPYNVEITSTGGGRYEWEVTGVSGLVAQGTIVYS